jgi:hypothetical protein
VVVLELPGTHLSHLVVEAEEAEEITIQLLTQLLVRVVHLVVVQVEHL